MRAERIAVLSLACALALAACGGGAHRARSGARSHAARQAGASARPVKRSEAAAFASAVNLRPADLPGFRASRESVGEAAGEARSAEAFKRCVGHAAYIRAIYEASSPTFELKGLPLEVISSDVELARTTRLASEELAAEQSAHTGLCLRPYMETRLRRQHGAGLSVGPVSVSALRPSAPGAAGSFGWRVQAIVTLHGLRLPLQLDLLGFGYRSATVVLLALSFPREPYGAQRRLFSLLLARAREFPKAPPPQRPPAARAPALTT